MDTRKYRTYSKEFKLEDYYSECRRLGGLGIKMIATEHAWLHVRSLYFSDPEGNRLELVAYDPSVG